MNVYAVTLRRTRTVNIIRQAGQLWRYNLRTAGDLDYARDFVQRTSCDYRPWEIVSVEERA